MKSFFRRRRKKEVCYFGFFEKKKKRKQHLKTKRVFVRIKFIKCLTGKIENKKTASY